MNPNIMRIQGGFLNQVPTLGSSELRRFEFVFFRV